MLLYFQPAGLKTSEFCFILFAPAGQKTSELLSSLLGVTLRCSALLYSTLLYTILLCSTLLCPALPCSTILYLSLPFSLLYMSPLFYLSLLSILDSLHFLYFPFCPFSASRTFIFDFSSTSLVSHFAPLQPAQLPGQFGPVFADLSTTLTQVRADLDMVGCPDHCQAVPRLRVSMFLGAGNTLW